MEVPLEYAMGTPRFSVGRFVTAGEVDQAVGERAQAVGAPARRVGQPSRAFRKFVTSYFGICSTAQVAVGRAYLYRMAKLTYHGLTKRCNRWVSAPGERRKHMRQCIRMLIVVLFLVVGTAPVVLASGGHGG